MRMASALATVTKKLPIPQNSIERPPLAPQPVVMSERQKEDVQKGHLSDVRWNIKTIALAGEPLSSSSRIAGVETGRKDMFWVLKGGWSLRSGADRSKGGSKNGCMDGRKEYTWLLETNESRGQVSRSIAFAGMSRNGNTTAE